MFELKKKDEFIKSSVILFYLAMIFICGIVLNSIVFIEYYIKLVHQQKSLFIFLITMAATNLISLFITIPANMFTYYFDEYELIKPTLLNSFL